MKKIIAITVMMALIASAAFAQVTGYGRVRTDFAADINLDDSDKNSWAFPAPSVRIGLRGSNDVVNFFAQFDGTWRGNATVNIGNFALSAGQNELPWAQWSSFALFGHQNSGFGASNSLVTPYIMGGFAGVYLGITSGTRINSQTMNDFPFPGFFAGYDYKADSFSVGGAFAGLANNTRTAEKTDDVFSWMGKIHAKFNLDPAAIGINVAFYSAPEFGFFNLSQVSDIIGGTDAMVLEAMIDASIRLDICTIGLSGAFVGNFADDDKDGGGSALRFGASANFNLGGGFRLIPGVMFTHYLNGKGGASIDKSDLRIGATFLFSY